MSNTYGRQVVVPLTNKSGGGVIAGDVVVIDTANDDSFTTNTAGAFTGGVGIAQATIASNAVGPVLIAGYAALVNVDSSVTRGHFGKTYTVAKQATDAGASRVSGTFCEFLTGGTTPSASVYPPDISATYGGPTWATGTSMPGSPTTNDRVTRTDILGGTDFEYDGTQWRSVGTFFLPLNQGPSTGATFANIVSAVPFKGTYTWYLLSAELVTQLTGGTSDATHYWTIAINWVAADTSRTSLGSVDTKTDVASNATYHTVAINAVLSTSAVGFDVLATKSSTPPNLNFGGVIAAQLIAT